MSAEVAGPSAAPQADAQPQGMRKNGMLLYSPAHCQFSNISQGKQWHPQKTAFRPTSGMTSWEKRQEGRKATAAVKAKEKEMKEEKEAERQVSASWRVLFSWTESLTIFSRERYKL